MAQTIFGRTDAKTVKRFSVVLAAETWQKSFWGRNFMSTGVDKPIQRITDLERSAGDTVTVDLFNNLTGIGITGDNLLKGNEEALTAYTQQLWIDQLRHGASLGGQMTRQRTVHDLRSIARDKLSTWWSRVYDEAMFCYLAGGRGVETGDWLMSTSRGGATTTLYANNTITAVEDAAKIWTGAAVADVTLDNTATYNFTLPFLEKIMYQLRTMANPPRPLMVDGEDCYIVIMHPQAELQLRSTATAGGWQDIQKYTQRADNLFKRSLGKYGNLILYSHPKIPVYNTGAAGVGVCYNLLLGAQAGFIAHGNSGNGMHYSWHEEIDDRGNLPVVDTGAIFGMQRAIWNSKSFSTMLCVSNYAGTAS